METTCTNDIDVSVYILTYYHEEYLAQAIESVLSQKTHFKFEIVISDDCSKDNTVNIIKHYCELYPNIIRAIYNKENIGISKNMFQARCHCKGKYIVVLSGDDYWINDSKIEIQASFLENHPEYIAVFNGIEKRYDNDTFSHGVLPKKTKRNREFTIKDYEKGDVLRSHGFMMRNLFLNPSDLEYFRQAQFISDKIDDAVDMVLLPLKGRVFILDDITDAYRVRRTEKEKSHNFNSINQRIDKLRSFFQLTKNLDSFVNKDHFSVNFRHKYKVLLAVCLIDMLISGNVKGHMELIRSIPAYCKHPLYKSVYISLLPELFIIATKKVLGGLQMLFFGTNDYTLDL